MQFAAIQKNSFIDYPQKIACLLFTQGCNFFCPYCHNPSLIPINKSQRSSINTKDVFDFLKDRKGLLDAVVVTGGEPTLHKKLLDFFVKIKEMGFLVKVDTNGSNPNEIKKYVEEKVVDYIAMDIKGLPQDYVNFFCKTQDIEKKIIKSIDIIMKNNIDYEFRTTCVSPFISLNVVSKLAPLLQNAKRWFFQECTNLENTLNPDFFKKKSNVLNRKELDKLVKVARNFVQNAEIR